MMCIIHNHIIIRVRTNEKKKRAKTDAQQQNMNNHIPPHAIEKREKTRTKKCNVQPANWFQFNFLLLLFFLKRLSFIHLFRSRSDKTQKNGLQSIHISWLLLPFGSRVSYFPCLLLRLHQNNTNKKLNVINNETKKKKNDEIQFD